MHEQTVETDLIFAKVERLCLLQDRQRASKSHRKTKDISRRLTQATARVAALEARAQSHGKET